jgi:hypothetical protein
MNQHENDREVIVEYVVRGRYMKVSAIDPVTQEEASIVADRQYSQDYLAKQAIKKLRFMQSKRQDT